MATGSGQPLWCRPPDREKSRPGWPCHTRTSLPSPLSALLAVLALGAVGGLAGCHAVDFYAPTLQSEVPPEMEPPRELEKISLPAYRVQPPDLLSIECSSRSPCRPIALTSTTSSISSPWSPRLRTSPIDGYFLVEGRGDRYARAHLRAGAAGGDDRSKKTTETIPSSNSSLTLSPSRCLRAIGPNGRHPRRSPATIWSAPMARST